MKLLDKKGFLDLEKIKNYVAYQFAEIIEEESDYFSNVEISLTDTRQFANIKDKLENRIYIVVKFGTTTMNYNQYALPLTITAISEQNSLELCRKLLYLYAQKYNLYSNEDESLSQFYSSPETTELFQEVYSGFRATYVLSGTMLISEQTNPIKIEYKDETSEEYDEVDIINFDGSLNISLDSKVPFGNDNFSRSVGQYGTQTLSFVMYLSDNQLSQKLIKIFLRKPEVESRCTVSQGITRQPIVDYPFTLRLSFPKVYDKEGKICSLEKTFKLSNLNISKEIGGFTMATVVFSS